MSSLFWGIVVVVIAVVVLLAVLKKGQPGKGVELPYESCRVLFSPAERSFLGVLEQALGEDFQVFGKVRLNDIICVQKGLPKSAWQSANNKIDRKHIDFVICKSDDLSILAAVELDDKSHGRKDRVNRDEFLDLAFGAAGIPLVHFPAQKGYGLENIKSKLHEVLSFSQIEQTEIEERTELVEAAVAPIQQAVVDESLTVEKTTDPTPVGSVCQKCGKEMVKRKASKGIHAGQFFWACSGFPKCRNVMPIAGEESTEV